MPSRAVVVGKLDDITAEGAFLVLHIIDGDLRWQCVTPRDMRYKFGITLRIEGRITAPMRLNIAHIASLRRYCTEAKTLEIANSLGHLYHTDSPTREEDGTLIDAPDLKLVSANTLWQQYCDNVPARSRKIKNPRGLSRLLFRLGFYRKYHRRGTTVTAFIYLRERRPTPI